MFIAINYHLSMYSKNKQMYVYKKCYLSQQAIQIFCIFRPGKKQKHIYKYLLLISHTTSNLQNYNSEKYQTISKNQIKLELNYFVLHAIS